MTFTSLADLDLDALGMVGVIEDPRAGTLTFRFTDRVEVWTLAPAGYPIDGSVEVVRLGGRIYAAPPKGQPA
jgi:hypothetical protein